MWTLLYYAALCFLCSDFSEFQREPNRDLFLFLTFPTGTDRNYPTQTVSESGWKEITGTARNLTGSDRVPITWADNNRIVLHISIITVRRSTIDDASK